MAWPCAAAKPSGRTARCCGSADGGQLPFDTLIVAAGAWSGRLARSFGDRVLLESERGYNTTLPEPGIQLRAEVIFAERKFVATPLAPGLRIGGAAEFAGLEAPPNYARCDALLVAGGSLPSRFASRWRHAMDGSSADDTRLLAGHRPFATPARRVLRLRAWPYRTYARTDDGPSDRRPGRGPTVPARPRAVRDRTVQLSGTATVHREPPCVSAG